MDRTNWNFVVFIVTTIILPPQVHPTWWYLSQLPVHSLSLVGTGVICENIPGLIGKQRRLCRENPDVMMSVVKGAKMGVRECQSQFKTNRWNCSTSDRDASVFGKVMLKVGSREASFVYSVSSAGVVHAITRACSKGVLMNCACDPSKVGYHKDKRGEFKWGGCSDNVKFGSDFTRQFVDARERKIRDARAMMNIHNNRAGRKAVQKFMKLECKCHGVSGSCAIRTCWQAMQDFKRVGVLLRDKYNGAIEVEVDQDGGLIVANKNHKQPTRSDLVYFENSPDYCVEDSATGSLGTAGRECKRGSKGTDGCDIMCCGRGYDTKTVQRTRKCECKFIWCCHVKCQECLEMVDVHTCKGRNPIAQVNDIDSNAPSPK